eukprot:jgi/Picre1/31635/NNA_006986.t1
MGSESDIDDDVAPKLMETNMLVWEELLSSPEPEIFGPRARSASDAGVLRRKGHLKEQDKFIQFLLDMHETHTSLEVMEKLINGYLNIEETQGRQSSGEWSQQWRSSILHCVWLKLSLSMTSFSLYGTLYADGAHMQHDNDMIHLIISLMKRGVHVAIVTAAGYPNDADKFEQRVEGLLAAFSRLDLPKSVTDKFHIMGGECNYLLRVATCDKTYRRRLEFVPEEEWKSSYMMSWKQEDINKSC